MSEREKLRGRCLCGAVRYELRTPTRGSAHCHCNWCRRAHGAAFVTWLVSAADRFTLAAGEQVLSWYSATEQSRRGFCSRCGTTMFYESSAAPGETHVASATLIDPPDQEPKAHVFFDQRVPWLTINDGLPTCASSDPGLAEYAVIRAFDPEA